MKLALVIEEIIAAHPSGIARPLIEVKLRDAQIKGSSPANVKRVLAHLVAKNQILVEGKSVARIYKPAAAGLDPVPSFPLPAIAVPISKDLLEAVRRTAKTFGMFEMQRTGDFIDAVLRDWVNKTSKDLDPKFPGHAERVQWVLDLLKNQAADGRVGPVGAKRLAREMTKGFPGRSLSVSFITSTLKELVQRGDLEVEVSRAGPVGCIYRIR